jgi:ABC-type bacteriocin/lantibiotic exporter with double-glycine peptidase domain
MLACEQCRFDWGNLARGLDTHLGQNGGNLSVGDRQRIVCARTVLMRRPCVAGPQQSEFLSSHSICP